MKRFLNWKTLLIGVIVIIFLLMSSNETAEESFNAGRKAGNQAASVEEDISNAKITGKGQNTGEVINDINVWENPGSGGAENVTVGIVPHGASIKLSKQTEIDGIIFYYISSSVGQVSVLPTNLAAREKAMRERPKSEWFVEADESYPVEGWVNDMFVENIE